MVSTPNPQDVWTSLEVTDPSLNDDTFTFQGAPTAEETTAPREVFVGAVTPFEEPKVCAENTPVGPAHTLSRAAIQIGPDTWITQDDPCMPIMRHDYVEIVIDGETYEPEMHSRFATAAEIAHAEMLVAHEQWADALQVGVMGVIMATAFDLVPVDVYREAIGPDYVLRARFMREHEEAQVIDLDRTLSFYNALLDAGVMAEPLHVKVIAARRAQAPSRRPALRRGRRSHRVSPAVA